MKNDKIYSKYYFLSYFIWVNIYQLQLFHSLYYGTYTSSIKVDAKFFFFKSFDLLNILHFLNIAVLKTFKKWRHKMVLQAKVTFENTFVSVLKYFAFHKISCICLKTFWKETSKAVLSGIKCFHLLCTGIVHHILFSF